MLAEPRSSIAMAGQRGVATRLDGHRGCALTVLD
jgi:hypothetical protein